jgi:hypothetical protein
MTAEQSPQTSGSSTERAQTGHQSWLALGEGAGVSGMGLLSGNRDFFSIPAKGKSGALLAICPLSLMAGTGVKAQGSG